MTKQIFKNDVPNNYFYSFLDKICLKTEKYYLIDMNAFRKMLFYNYHEEFCETLKQYYHLSKQFYVDRKMTYNSFTTIVRQICKNNNIMFTSQIKYNESKYNIDYLIYFSLDAHK
jgi:tRNA G18 (ribose-2'-O)-methylase SpoU